MALFVATFLPNGAVGAGVTLDEWQYLAATAPDFIVADDDAGDVVAAPDRLAPHRVDILVDAASRQTFSSPR